VLDPRSLDPLRGDLGSESVTLYAVVTATPNDGVGVLLAREVREVRE
jgi:hypothetical protein